MTYQVIKKRWSPARMEGEVKVYCFDCNGYLFSDGETPERPKDFAIPCPKRQNGKCGYGGGAR
jgi:hypothetical protein